MTRKYSDLPLYSWVEYRTVVASEHGPAHGVFCRTCKQHVTHDGCGCGGTPPAWLQDLQKDW